MTNADRVDVVVAGGGPAGLSAAAEIARHGKSVTLLEREDEIGSPVHTSGATAPATVERYGIPPHLYHPVQQLRFRGPHAEANFAYDKPELVILDVRGTYQYLAEEVAAWGGEVRTASVARDVLRDGDSIAGVTVNSRGEQYSLRSRVVVDATGYRASISKAAGLHPGFDRFGVGAEVELIAPNCRQDEAVMVVGSRYAPAGYAWVFPWGEGRVRVGVGVHHGDVRSNPREHLAAFLDEAAELHVDLSGSTQTEEHFGLIPAHALPRRFSGAGVLAVGDAACQATLVVGEGIRVSLDAGRLAGRTIAASIEASSYASGGLDAYEKAFRRAFERNLKIGYAINRRLAAFDDDEWDEKIELLSTLPKSALPRALQSDFSPWTALQLITRGSPRLWLTMARYAARGARGRLTSSRPGRTDLTQSADR